MKLTKLTSPVRIQLSRKAGFNLQNESHKLNGLPCVKVSRPSKWGNPFKIGKEYNVFQACDHFERHLLAGELKITIEEVRRELRGKNLACWCAASPCHADVLLRLANGLPEPSRHDDARKTK